MGHEKKMQAAIDEALIAASLGEVPIGAALWLDDRLIATGRNRRLETSLATSHAEIEVINAACLTIGDWRLEGFSLYVTAEPCIMCAGAILQARIKEVFFGVTEPKFGGLVSQTRLFDIATLNHHPLCTGGIREEEIRRLMKDFFKKLR